MTAFSIRFHIILLTVELRFFYNKNHSVRNSYVTTSLHCNNAQRKVGVMAVCFYGRFCNKAIFGFTNGVFYFDRQSNCNSNFNSNQLRRWRSGLERLYRKQKVGSLNPNRERPRSLKQIMTAPRKNARYQVFVSEMTIINGCSLLQ